MALFTWFGLGATAKRLVRFSFVSGAVLLLVGCQPSSVDFKPEARLQLGDRLLAVEIARTAPEQYQGLSDRDSLCPDCGMLFVFATATRPTFVMRRMHFPLDMVWISEGRVAEIHKNLPPEGKSPRHFYRPAQPIEAILEINGGYCERYNIRVGDKVKILPL